MMKSSLVCNAIVKEAAKVKGLNEKQLVEILKCSMLQHNGMLVM